MTLVKFQPSGELANFDKRIKKFFEDFDAPFWGNWNWSRGLGIDFNSNVFTPRVDVKENGRCKRNVKLGVLYCPRYSKKPSSLTGAPMARAPE